MPTNYTIDQLLERAKDGLDDEARNLANELRRLAKHLNDQADLVARGLRPHHSVSSNDIVQSGQVQSAADRYFDAITKVNVLECVKEQQS